MKKLFVSVLLSATVALSGCATTPAGTQLSPAGQVLIQESAAIATRDYLRRHPNDQARITNIRAVVEKVAAVTSTTATVGDLKAVVIAEVNARVGDPLDRADVLSLVNVFYALLLEQVGSDKLDLKGVVKVNEVLGYILAALPS